MKNLLKIVSIIGLTVITQTAYSAAVTDSFNTGDILTAEKLNNIKDAVNDNDTRISNIVLTPGPAGPAGLGAELKTTAPTVTDDMNIPYSVGTVWVDTSTNMLYILEDNTANAAVWTIAAAPAVTYAIGDTGPAGGIVFYVTAGGLRGLEAAPTDHNTGTGFRWDSVDIPNTDTGAIADGIGAGDMNTTLIIAETAGDQATYAAGIAANLVISHLGVDYGDWYLPSKFELNLMWINLADPIGDGRAVGFDADSLGGFSSTFYWSSSQSTSSSFHAWSQQFLNGVQSVPLLKTYTLRVRAVRAF
jgi:hypothetical protein